MKTQSNKYKTTIEVYEKLGRKYIKDTKSLSPPEISGFIKLLPPKGSVLEIGCAGGRDSKRFAAKGFKITGIDLVRTFLQEAQKAVPSGRFVKMDMRHLKFPSNYFDAVWANAVLLHLKKKDIPPTLKGFFRVLKKGGKMHIRVKKGTGVTYEKDKLSSEEKRLFTYFSKNELKKFVTNAGFKILLSRIFSDEAKRGDLKWISLWAVK